MVCTPKGWNDGGGREGRTEGEALVVHARDEEGIHGQAAGGGRDMVPFLSSLARPLRRKVHEKNSTHAARPFPKQAIGQVNHLCKKVRSHGKGGRDRPLTKVVGDSASSKAIEERWAGPRDLNIKDETIWIICQL